MSTGDEEIINKVAMSGLITLDLEDYFHHGERVEYDIAQHLFQGLILKEKDFRDFIKGHDWSQYQDKNIFITCSADAIVPTWAYMLLTSRFSPYAHMIIFGGREELEGALFREALAKIPLEEYRNAKLVIKGCGKYPVPASAYVEISRLLTPVVQSLMYGEPCSTVPVFKKSK